ncbi:NUDIX hydrolase [Lactobacillus sp. CC-MHH1034]|uniref:NUDIX hydrolase n=1 Tax=Agrilactobacillus fermenti TaxID=2586909 RepID=UPI001E2AD003|nr:NUDIX hydrolase [Agrilactobacillus fermenti]MCD2257516.1 NUDIX hydrolase [Agrilactobacillus fermenti]
MSKKFHRAFGVYGIIYSTNGLAVIKKNGGPYINRYDLPGGSLEDGESLYLAIKREIKEETRLVVDDLKQIGITSFKYPWHYEQWRYNQHICVFYDVTHFTGKIAENVKNFEGQDSLGAKFISLNNLTIENASPLVLKAKEYIQNGRKFDSKDKIFKNWIVLEKEVF